MKTTQPKSLKSRAAALGLGLALAAGFSVTAAPAHAAPAYSVTGTVTVETEDGQSTTPLEGADVASTDGTAATQTAADGSFELSFENGSYEVAISSTGYVTETLAFDVVDGDVAYGEIILVAEAVETPAEPTPGETPAEPAPVETPAVPVLPALPAGTVTISGTQTVGSTLTATSTGWPEGTTLSYSWGAVVPGQQNSGDIPGAEGSTYVVTAETVNKRILAFVVGSKDGYEYSFASAALPAPVQATAPAPVANSTELAAYLAENESTTMSQTAAGLPASSLDPTKSYTANVPFSGDDSFVDAYLYSTPTLVGSFPVVNGIAQVQLSADVLRKVGAGPHTLVVVGQFFGDVSSVTINVSAVPAVAGPAMLAATGIETALPVGAAAILLLLGGAMVLVNRRRMHA